MKASINSQFTRFLLYFPILELKISLHKNLSEIFILLRL